MFPSYDDRDFKKNRDSGISFLNPVMQVLQVHIISGHLAVGDSEVVTLVTSERW